MPTPVVSNSEPPFANVFLKGSFKDSGSQLNINTSYISQIASMIKVVNECMKNHLRYFVSDMRN